MAHKHSIYDSDVHFIIDPITRKIKSESGKVILMQNDHNSERFTFQIPRYIEGHDMSLCNTTEIHYVNTDSENKRNQNEDIYPVTDLQVSPESEDIVIGSWLISQNATTYSGALNFIMRFACVNDKQELEYQWFTDVYSVIQIAKGIYNVDVMTNNDDPDLLAAWKKECLELTTNATTEICNEAIEKTTLIRDEAVNTLSGIRNEAVDTMNNICSEAKTEMVEVRDEAVAAITNIRNEAIDTSNETDEAISEFSKKLSDTVFMVNFETGDLEYESQNYTFSVNPVTGNLEWEYVGTPSGGIVGLADQLAKSKSDAIVLTAEGESIVVEDSSDDPLQVLRVFGKTTQNGTPTPDAPVPLVSVGDAGSVEVGVYGKNLLGLLPDKVVTKSGLTGTINADGSITVNGTPNKAYATCYFATISLEPGTYFVSGGVATDKMYAQVVIIDSEGNRKYYSNRRFVIDGTESSVEFTIQAGEHTDTISNYTVYPMLNLGSIALPFEPYKAKQTLTISTPNGLPGIPVTDASLANYTDADGQMWCSDEVDFERGVYVQRVAMLEFDGDEVYQVWTTQNGLRNRYMYNITSLNILPLIATKSVMKCNALSAGMMSTAYNEIDDNVVFFDITSSVSSGNKYIGFCSSKFPKRDDFRAYLTENPITVLYILATPIETPLTSDILSTYSMLHSNYPVTTVLNDAGAHMEFGYNADPKNYIDTKLAEIRALIS